MVLFVRNHQLSNQKQLHGITHMDERSELLRQNNVAAYLPKPNEVSYDLRKVSQRLLFVREQIARLTCYRAAIKLGVPESTLREYEGGSFEPRIKFFNQALQNDDYRPYLHFLLTGEQSVDYSSTPEALPKFSEFKHRLCYLRERVFHLSRPAFAKMLNDSSPWTIKNYELGWREPAIQFLQRCASLEFMRPYFCWLFFIHLEPLSQDLILFPDVVDIEDRVKFKEALAALKRPNAKRFQPQKTYHPIHLTAEDHDAFNKILAADLSWDSLSGNGDFSDELPF